MKKDQKTALRVGRETIRKLSNAQLGDAAGGQFIPSHQLLPTICLACQN